MDYEEYGEQEDPAVEGAAHDDGGAAAGWAARGLELRERGDASDVPVVEGAGDRREVVDLVAGRARLGVLLEDLRIQQAGDHVLLCGFLPQELPKFVTCLIKCLIECCVHMLE